MNGLFVPTDFVDFYILDRKVVPTASFNQSSGVVPSYPAMPVDFQILPPLQDHNTCQAFVSNPEIGKRKGNWTKEEEEYAAKLIEEFNLGRLTDVEPSYTLRKFLSEKLNCDGMRISRKFGGLCLGKVCLSFYSTYDLC
jgi:hypothetical protein